jgi:hypothetical protein
MLFNSLNTIYSKNHDMHVVCLFSWIVVDAAADDDDDDDDD